MVIFKFKHEQFKSSRYKRYVVGSAITNHTHACPAIGREFDFQKCRCRVIIYDQVTCVIQLYSLIIQICWRLTKYDLKKTEFIYSSMLFVF